METEKQIQQIALENGATLAGIASTPALHQTGSHRIYPRMDDYHGVGTVRDESQSDPAQWFNWPDAARSALVVALSHPADQPGLDWWDGRGTPGNRQLMQIIEKSRQAIQDRLGMETSKLHYYVEKGGVFLKDAAVLAGLGVIGRNNLLVTPSHGPRVRLRALFLHAELTPTGPLDFDPCADCTVDCRRVCPEKAMEKPFVREFMELSGQLPARDGAYSRERCNGRMEADEARSKKGGTDKPAPVKYCRNCEFVCPVGKGE